MPKKIYFLGGKLSRYEQEEFYDKYKPMLHSLVKEIGTSAQFEFVSIPECTRSQFSEYWSDPNTYGIFWFGHGTTSGLPATNEVRADNLNETLNPMFLEKSSLNLKFIALLSCFSGKYRDEWIKKLGNVFAQIKTFETTLEGGTGSLRAEIERWIENKSTLLDPTSGASGLLQYALRRSIWGVPTKAPLVISSDHFDPDPIYVKTVTIPKIGAKIAGHRPMPPFQVIPKPAIKKPPWTTPIDNWKFRKDRRDLGYRPPHRLKQSL